MDVFQSPLEALAINYVSFEYLPTVQSFLTCVAIVTAAISFWRIRAVGAISYHRTKSSGDDYPSSVDDARSALQVSPQPLPVSTRSDPELEPEKEKEKEKPFHQEEQAFSSIVGVGAIEYDDSNDRVIKDKFTLYYDDDQDANGSGEEDNITIGGDCNGDGLDVVCFYREKPYYSNGRLWSCDGNWVRRGGDLGWYRNQDLTVLNGSVVRLWNCQRRRC